MVGAAPAARQKMTAETLEKALDALIDGTRTPYRRNAAQGEEASHRQSGDTHNHDWVTGLPTRIGGGAVTSYDTKL